MAPIRWAIGLAVLLLIVWGTLAVAVAVFGSRDEARPADAIVVLGAAQYDGRPSPVLRARLDHALELYRRGTAARLIMTGGVGPGDTVSEAEVAKRYAEAEGVPATAILVERAGLSTDQSMTAVADLLRSNRLQSAILVSDPFHMLRLRMLAALHGIRAYSSPTRSSPIAPGTLQEWRHVAREGLILPFVLLEGR